MSLELKWLNCSWFYQSTIRGGFYYKYRDKLERFCANFDLLLSNINDLHPTCSIVLGNFNAKCSKWCASDRTNSASIELDNITATSGYNQMIGKPTDYINESSLIFSSNVNLTKNCGVEQSLYETCYHNIIYGTLNFNICLPLLILRKYGITNMQILNVSKNQYIILIGLGLSKIEIATKNAKILSETLLNIFHNFILPP